MLEKLKQVESRFSEIESKLTDPAYYSDPAAFQRLCREQKELQPVVETYRAYQKCGDELEQARALLNDPELHDMAQEEFEAAKARRAELEQALRLLLLPRDPNDERNVILEIRSGVGGEESALFAHSLYRMYTMYADAHGWKTELANLSETELGGVREASVLIEGAGAYSRLKFESGVHRVQRVPETEAGGRIHTSTATVAVLPELDEIEFHIDPKDLQIDTYRSSGAGGQHVNKTDSAVRLTHLPTGIVVACQKERSQHMNKEKAMNMLRAQLYEYYEDQKKAEMDRFYGAKSENGWGSQIRSYVFCPYTMVKDLRTECETSDVNGVMDGNIQRFIESWLQMKAAGEK